MKTNVSLRKHEFIYVCELTTYFVTIDIMNSEKRITTPKKLLKSKWTAVTPTRKEKHFMVTKLIVPEQPEQPIEYIEIEAVHSKRVQQIAWQALNDNTVWLQGWV